MAAEPAQPDAAEVARQQATALAAAERVLGGGGHEYVRLQAAARALPDGEAARELFRRALASHSASPMAEADTEFVPETRNALGVMEARLGNAPAAVALLTRAVRGAVPGSRARATYGSNLAAVLGMAGLRRKAARELRLILEAAEAPGATGDAWAQRRRAAAYDYASALNDLGRFGDAEKPARRAVELHREAGDGVPEVAASGTMAIVLLAVIVSAPVNAKYDEALALLSEARERAARGLRGDADALEASIDGIVAKVRRARGVRGGGGAAVEEEGDDSTPLCDAVLCDKPAGRMVCGKCRVTRYCGRDCQVAAWKIEGHKGECAGMSRPAPAPSPGSADAKAAGR